MSIRVISERIMQRGFEPSVQRLMDGVKENVAKQNGLQAIEQLQDSEDHTKYIILTQWKSKKHLDKWLKDPTYLKITKELDSILACPAKYRIFKTPKDDIFLL